MEKTQEKPTPIVTTKHESTWTLSVNFNIKETEDGWEYEHSEAVVDHQPELADIVNAVNERINAKTDERILSGLRWRDLPVWLSTENQINIKAAYDLAFQTGGGMLPIRFKLGEDEKGAPVYFDFEDLATFGDFYTNCVAWIQKCINEGWKEKDEFDYDELLNQ